MLTLQKIDTASDITGNTRCSFCGQQAAEGHYLIAGSGVFICDTCIATCNDLLADENAAADEDAVRTSAPAATCGSAARSNPCRSAAGSAGLRPIR